MRSGEELCGARGDVLKHIGLFAATALVFAPAALAGTGQGEVSSLELSALPKIATVDARYQSYNVEMVEVTGGRFWAPYGGPPGEVYRHRGPLDLRDPRLQALAKHLGPAYMRVSGTWANNTYLAAEGENLTQPPKGYKQVLTQPQWRDVIAFSKAVDAPIVTSFAVSGGTRGQDGRWRSDQAQRLIDLTREQGGTIAAAEFFNEPNVPSATTDMPKGYNADDYATDFRLFHDWARLNIPTMKILGPGGVGGDGLAGGIPVNVFGGGHIGTEDLMRRTPNSLDGVSYHFYGQVSERCKMLKIGGAIKADALKPAWLDATVADLRYYSGLRDKYEPGKPIWNTETAQAACGGSPWAATFLDTFRYVNQLGALAQKNVQVVMHNTLATSDYALIDRDTMTPRPNYWAAVLWKRTMGQRVLASPRSPSPDLRLYAQCLPEGRGGVGLVALNIGAARQKLALPSRARTWTMSGTPLDTTAVKVDGRTPALDKKGAITGLQGVAAKGSVSIPGESVTFIAVPGADNPACR